MMINRVFRFAKTREGVGLLRNEFTCRVGWKNEKGLDVYGATNERVVFVEVAFVWFVDEEEC